MLCGTCKKAKKWLGMLVKRPILVTDTMVLTGFCEKEWEKLG